MRTIETAHLHPVGAKVTLSLGAGFNVKAGDTYTVSAQLPPLGDVLQYRIKSDNEPYERVVSEPQISRISPTTGSSEDAFARARQLT